MDKLKIAGADLEQWIPAYGIYRMYKDKDSIADTDDPGLAALYTLYQGISSFLVLSGIALSLEKVIQSIQ